MPPNLLAKADLSGLKDSRILVILRGPGEKLMVTLTESLVRRRFEGRLVRVVDISKEVEDLPVEIGLIANIPPERFRLEGAGAEGSGENGGKRDGKEGERERRRIDWRKLEPVEVLQ